MYKKKSYAEEESQKIWMNAALKYSTQTEKAVEPLKAE